MERLITFNLNDNFITCLVDYIDEHYIQQGRDISRLVLVFGGKRPALFVKRELAKRMKTAFFSPQFFSIDGFVDYVGEKEKTYSKIQDLEACYIIYSLVQDIAPELLVNKNTFHAFLPWAREIVGFINNLDVEQVEDSALIDVQQCAAIGYDVPFAINQLLQSMTKIRTMYHERLLENKIASRGLRYMQVADAIKDTDLSEFDDIFFCNFFYLHAAEKTIIGELYKKQKARIFLHGNIHEWEVMKKWTSSLCEVESFAQPVDTSSKTTLYSAFDAHSQVGTVREILKTIDNFDNTVVVLPNPENIVPLLSEVSTCIGECNVSMGYPLQRSPMVSLLEHLMRAQQTKKKKTYYAKDYLKVITHPFVKNMRVHYDAIVTRILMHAIEEIVMGLEKDSITGTLFIDLEEVESIKKVYDIAQKRLSVDVPIETLQEVVRKIHTLFFVQWETITTFEQMAMSLEEVINLLVHKSFLAAYPLNIKVTQRIFSLIEGLKNLSFAQESFLQEELFAIFRSQLSSEKISFLGSPLKGLQILGLFETRSLNFDNVIIMDVNESILPNLHVHEPLIPRDVVASIGLDRVTQEEEIQKYHFQRLISSAKNVHLIFEENTRKEKSRFIEQIIWDAQKREGALIDVAIEKRSFDINLVNTQQCIKKTQEMVDLLATFTFSASSMNTYLNCPLRFYYHYVLGLREKEELFEDPEGADIGDFIHKLLEKTFYQFIDGKPKFTEDFISYFFKELDLQFDKYFGRKMKSDAFLLKTMIEYRLQSFIKKEQGRSIEKIISLEDTFYSTLRCGKHSCKFVAKIDRIDLLALDELLILDYKTGVETLMPKALDKLLGMDMTRESIKRTVRSFQLPLYYHLVEKKYQDYFLNAALYNLRTMECKYFFKNNNEEYKGKVVTECMNALTSTVLEILNPDISFEPDKTNQQICQHCPFTYLCK